MSWGLANMHRLTAPISCLEDAETVPGEIAAMSPAALRDLKSQDIL